MTLLEQSTKPARAEYKRGVPWTAARIAALKKYQADGFSSAEMAAALGGVTRNAVIGKITRLGLAPGKEYNAQMVRHGVKTRVPRVRPQVNDGLQFDKIKPEARREGFNARYEREQRAAELREKFQAVEIVDLPPDESAVAVEFMQLSDATCRWPLGDPRDFKNMLFCGEKPHKDYPYCTRHCLLAYRLPPAHGDIERLAKTVKQ